MDDTRTAVEAGGETTVATSANEPPEDFAEYERWLRSQQDGSAAAGGPASEKKTEAGGEKAGSESGDEDTDETKGQEKQGDGGDEVPGKGEDPADGDRKKRLGGYQRTIEKLKGQNEELERRLAALEGRPADKDAGDGKSGKAGAAQGEPKEEDFDDYKQFQRALIAYELDQREANRQAVSRQQDLVKNWTGRLAEARKDPEMPDFDEVVDQDLQVTPAMQQALLESEVGAKLAYYLGKHPEEAEKIAQLSPIGAARALGRIEQTLTPSTKPPEEKEKKVSKAPPPVKPVGGGKATPRLEDLTNDFSAYEARWKTEQQGR